jgi:transcriptional regulator with XRE-family HTH domain
MLGDILQRVRLSHKLSQETVAARARLSREYISMIERNLNSPTVDAFLRICQAIGVCGSDIFRELERRQKPVRRVTPKSR